MLYVFIETIIFAIQLQVMQVTISNCVNLISNKKKKKKWGQRNYISASWEKEKLFLLVDQINYVK